MTQRVLVIEADEAIRKSAASVLEGAGYDVITAADASRGMLKVKAERPNLILAGMYLPGFGGQELARKLHTEVETAHVPIILCAPEDALDQLVIGTQSDVADVLMIPFQAGELVEKAQAILGKESDRPTVVSTGNGELDSKMGGGVPLGSFTLIEGASGAGKSVLAQQMIWGSLNDGFRLSLFTSENTVRSLVKQMRSLSLDIIDHVLLDRLRIYPMELARLGREAPATFMRALRHERDRHMIIVDSITSVIAGSSQEEILGCMEECKRLCGTGVTIIIILHSHGVNSDTLIRLRALCDAHLNLRSEEVGGKLVRTLEVTKIRGANRTTGNIVSFEVEPGWGMRLIPISKVKG
ncbi:MAG: ATPase domain-containing protein [Anaerolineae bacterium]